MMLWRLLGTYVVLAIALGAVAHMTNGKFRWREQEIAVAAFFFFMGAMAMGLWS